MLTIDDGCLSQPADRKWPDLGDSREVPVDVHYTEPVMQSRLGDQQVGDGGAMPHPVMMSEVSLEFQGALEDVGRCGHDPEAGVELVSQRVVIRGGPRRVELLMFTDRTDAQVASELSQLRAHDGVASSRSGTLVEYPAAHRHIRSEARTSRSACLCSTSR
jgi:hypothetical protein